MKSAKAARIGLRFDEVQSWSGFQRIHLRSDARITLAACWAHASRNLHELRLNFPLETSVLLGLIGQLYDIDSRAKVWSVVDRAALQVRESSIVLGRIRTNLDSDALSRVLPKSDLDEHAYLSDELRQILGGSTDWDSLRADHWKLSHPESVRTYRANECSDAVDRARLRRARRRVLASNQA